MAERTKATKDTPRRVTAKTGVRRPSPAASSGGVPASEGESGQTRAAGSRAVGSKAVGSKAVGSKAVGSKAVGSKAVGSKAVGSKAVGSKAVGSKAVGSRAAADGPAAADGLAGADGPAGADSGRYAELRAVLSARLAELTAEYDSAVVALTDLQRSRVADGAGDDQADTGTKTFEREQEISLVHGLRERVQQVEHALARLAEGTYGSCERCGNAIPTARLEAFPSVTLCVSCKQIEERR